ncbi:hypothetical protein AB0O76_41310 [Streptomyces sp. NPDC086554]
MRLGKALATGIAEEQPREERVEDAVRAEQVQDTRESAAEAPVEVPAAR